MYHFTTSKTWEKIKASGGLRPQTDKDGNYTFTWESFQTQWLRATRFFSSPIQALMIGMATWCQKEGGSEKLILLKISPNPETDVIHVQNLAPMFNHLNLYTYYKSRKDYSHSQDTPDAIAEYIIRNKTTNLIPLEQITVVHEIPANILPKPSVLWTRQFVPELLLNHLSHPDLGPIPVTGKEPIRLFEKNLYKLLQWMGAALHFLALKSGHSDST